MHDPFPVDVLQMSLFAGADETDRRHVGFLAVVENELPAPSSRVEILPPHEPTATRRFAVNDIGLNLLAQEIGWETPAQRCSSAAAPVGRRSQVVCGAIGFSIAPSAPGP